MKHLIIAKRLQELGHPTRLNVYKRLIKSGPSGLIVGRIQKSLDIPASTLSHHLSRLAAVGLIRQERQGTQLTCHPEIGCLNEVLEYLQSECCHDTGKSC